MPIALKPVGELSEGLGLAMCLVVDEATIASITGAQSTTLYVFAVKS